MRVHETLVRSQLGEALTGHVSRDSSTIEVREKPVKAAPPQRPHHTSARPRNATSLER